MIAVIPIAVGVPPAAVFVPPTMPLIPAAFPRFTQFVASMFRLGAIPAVMFRGSVELVVRLGDSALATIVVLGGCPGCSCECQHAYKSRSREQRLSEKLLLSRVKRHVSSILPNCPRLGWGVLYHRTHLRGECSERQANPLKYSYLTKSRAQYACKNGSTSIWYFSSPARM